MQIIAEAFFLGLVGGLVPGSINTILLISVMRGGFKSGLRVFTWSFISELSIVTLLLATLIMLPLKPDVFYYIGLIGSAVLFYFAYQILKLSKFDTPDTPGEVFSLGKIYVLAATNTSLYVFWITICAPLVWQLAEQFNLYVSAFYFMVAFELGWVISTFAILIVFVKAKSILTNPVVMKKVFVVVALFMLLLGVRMLYNSLSALDLLS